MHPQSYQEPSPKRRQPFGDRTNGHEDLAPAPHPRQIHRTPRSLPPPEFVRLQGRMLGGRESVDCLPIGRFVRLVQWEGTLVVVKHGSNVPSADADIMRLARANTAVPVPEVLGVVHEADKTYLYIEYIDGKTLDEAWGTLSSTDIARIKSSFATSLLSAHTDWNHRYRLSSPGRALNSKKPEPVVRSVDDFRRWIRFEIDRRSLDLVTRQIPSDFEGVLADGHVCLVHADLHAENMLVKNSRIVAILDWVMASWLPRAVQSYVMVNYLQADRLGPGSVFNALGDVQPRP
ncbi:hypothetical protein JCM10295v2_006385 [Rhodotorula toruloides]